MVGRYEGGREVKLRHVDPRKIQVPEVRVTARMDEETAHQFEESVKTAGIDEPIKVFEVDGQLILSDGLHRLQAAIANKMPLVDVYVKEGTMVDVLCNNLMSGHLRGTHPVSEMVRSIEELWKEYKMDSEQIAAKTGMTRDYVENLMLISNLTPWCREILDSGRIKGIGIFIALTKVTDPATQETLLGQQLQFHWSVKEFQEQVRATLALQVPPEGQTPAAPPVEFTPVCHFCREAKPIGQIANPNVCTECSGMLLMLLAQARAVVTAETIPETE